MLSAYVGSVGFLIGVTVPIIQRDSVDLSWTLGSLLLLAIPTASAYFHLEGELAPVWFLKGFSKRRGVGELPGIALFSSLPLVVLLVERFVLERDLNASQTEAMLVLCAEDPVLTLNELVRASALL